MVVTQLIFGATWFRSIDYVAPVAYHDDEFRQRMGDGSQELWVIDVIRSGDICCHGLGQMVEIVGSQLEGQQNKHS